MDWKTYDSRPKHLRATLLGYELQSKFQVLRFPTIDGQEYRSTYPVLKIYHLSSAIVEFWKGENHYSWASG